MGFLSSLLSCGVFKVDLLPQPFHITRVVSTLSKSFELIKSLYIFQEKLVCPSHRKYKKVKKMIFDTAPNFSTDTPGVNITLVYSTA